MHRIKSIVYLSYEEILKIKPFLFVIVAVVSVKGQQKYCDSLRGEIPRFCKLIEDEAIEEFPKDYSRIGKCIEVDPTIPVLLNFNMMKLKALELQKKKVVYLLMATGL